MTLRPFRCPSCRHQLRFGAVRCGRCHDVTPYRNRWLALVPLAVLALILLLVAGLILLG